MARNVMAMTARGAMKAARVTAAGDTRTMAMMMATMTPNGGEDNEDHNSKNNDKATTKPTTTTEEGERRQSRRDNHGRGHHRPRDAAIVPTAASLRHTFVGSCCFRVERSELSPSHGNTQKIWMKHEKKSGTGARSGMVECGSCCFRVERSELSPNRRQIWNGWPANYSRFWTKSQKVGLVKIWRR